MSSTPSAHLRGGKLEKMSASLEELAGAKEKELNDLRQQQAQQTREAIKNLEQDLLKERERLSQLQADFDYNLSLIDSRDQQLAQYEANFVTLKRIVNALVAENSELKVRLDGICHELEGSKENQAQLKEYYQSRIKDIHSRMDGYRHAKQSELDCERSKLEELQRELEKKLLEVEGETHIQQDQLIADFEEILKQRDHQHQLRIQQLNSLQLSEESKRQSLERELLKAESTIVRQKKDIEERVGEAEQAIKEEKEKVARLEAELQVMENREHLLEEEAERAKTLLQRQQDSFQRKHAELDHLCRQKEASLKAAKETHSSREHSLKQQLLELQISMEQREEEWRGREKGLNQTIANKEELLQRAYKESSSCRLSCNDQVKDLTGKIVEKDLQIQTAEDACQTLRMQLHKMEKELAQVLAEHSCNEERVKAVELSHAQQRLEWEGRVREAEKIAYSKQQEVIKELTESRNKMSNEYRELQCNLDQHSKQFEVVQTERDAAVTLLHQHGISHDDKIFTGYVMDMQTLRAQNDELRHTIKQMRVELEQLSDSSFLNKQQNVPAANYVLYMEDEVRKVKAENRQLLDQLQQGQSVAQGKPPTPASARSRKAKPAASEQQEQKQEKGESAAVESKHRDHLIALSDTIASLQKQKGELEMQERDRSVKIDLLEKRLKEQEEMAYILKAGHVPQTKLHQKLVRATQVIIALVKEKEELTKKLPSQSGIPLATHVTQNTLSDFASPQSPKPIKLSRSVEKQIKNRSFEANGQQVAQPQNSSSSKSGVKSHEADASLESLLFTESSIDGLSLEQVVQQIDKNFTDISSVEGKGTKKVRHSTPQLSSFDVGVDVGSRGPQKEKGVPIDVALHLIGREVKPQVRSGVKQKAPVAAITSKSKTKVRNYASRRDN